MSVLEVWLMESGSASCMAGFCQGEQGIDAVLAAVLACRGSVQASDSSQPSAAPDAESCIAHLLLVLLHLVVPQCACCTCSPAVQQLAHEWSTPCCLAVAHHVHVLPWC